MYYAYLREDNESINLVDNSGVLSLIEDLNNSLSVAFIVAGYIYQI